MADSSEQVENIFPPGIKRALDSIAKKEGYITHHLSRRKDLVGQGFLSETYAIDIKGNTVEGDNKTNIFVKKSMTSDIMESYIDTKHIYEKEGYFYSVLAHILAKMQDDANIPVEDRYNIVKGYEESNEKAIYMENVTDRGFETCERMDVVSLKFLELSIQQLAKFHGLFYVIKIRKPDYFKQKLVINKHPVIFNDEWDAIATNTSLITCQELSKETKKRTEAFIPTGLKKMSIYIQEHTPYSTLCHGDYKLMNIMKKEVNGEVMEVLPIDYQNAYYGCPLNDFFYFVYGVTDSKMRKNHLHHLKDLYYESLDAFLKYFDMTAEEVFPRKAYEETFINKLDFGLTYNLVFYPYYFAPTDNVPDLSKDSMATVKYTLDVNIQQRIQKMVDEFIELGIL